MYDTATRRSLMDPSLRCVALENKESPLTTCVSRVAVFHVRSSSVDADALAAQRVPIGSVPMNNGKRETDVHCVSPPTLKTRNSGSACIINTADVSKPIAAGFNGDNGSV